MGTLNFKDLIYKVPNAISDDMCDHLIEYHTKMQNRGMSYDVDKKSDPRPFPDPDMDRIDITKSTNCLYEDHGDPKILKELNTVINKHFNVYGEQFNSEDFYLTDTWYVWPRSNYNVFQIQKYDKGVGHYQAWHIDKDYAWPFRNREYVYMFYLNDVDEGGETQFLYCDVSIKPVKGTLVYFPTNFPFVHRGKMPISNDKYIVTGWICEKRPEELVRK
jgi:hypothetical protein